MVHDSLGYTMSCRLQANNSGDVAQLTECLPQMEEALGSIPALYKPGKTERPVISIFSGYRIRDTRNFLLHGQFEVTLRYMRLSQKSNKLIKCFQIKTKETKNPTSSQ